MIEREIKAERMREVLAVLDDCYPWHTRGNLDRADRKASKYSQRLIICAAGTIVVPALLAMWRTCAGSLSTEWAMVGVAGLVVLEVLVFLAVLAETPIAGAAFFSNRDVLEDLCNEVDHNSKQVKKFSEFDVSLLKLSEAHLRCVVKHKEPRSNLLAGGIALAVITLLLTQANELFAKSVYKYAVIASTGAILFMLVLSMIGMQRLLRYKDQHDLLTLAIEDRSLRGPEAK